MQPGDWGVRDGGWERVRERDVCGERNVCAESVSGDGVVLREWWGVLAWCAQRVRGRAVDAGAGVRAEQLSAADRVL